jgi:hypothetical protein
MQLLSDGSDSVKLLLVSVTLRRGAASTCRVKSKTLTKAARILMGDIRRGGGENEVVNYLLLQCFALQTDICTTIHSLTRSYGSWSPHPWEGGGGGGGGGRSCGGQRRRREATRA